MRKRGCPKCKKRATTFEMIYEQQYGSTLEDFSSNTSLLGLYKSIVRQMHLLGKSIKLINPNKSISPDE